MSLRAFEAAARHLSFREAAQELGVTPTAISHQIRLLEESLGMALFIRQVRQVTLTDAGHMLYPALREGFDTFERAVTNLPPQMRRKAVTLTAPTLFTARRILPALGVFQREHSTFDLRLHASDELVNLHAGIADIAVRYATGPFDGLIAEPLLPDRFGILCSPLLSIVDRDDLKHSTLIHTEWKRPEIAPDWSRWAKEAGMEDLNPKEGIRFTDDGHALQAAIAGHGVAIASLVLARPEIEAGLLVHPFGPIIQGETYHIVATEENLKCDDVRAVVSWLKTTVAPEV